jgi:L-ascorbate metabolism protein UlaG (beta-lactamase superfamily)
VIVLTRPESRPRAGLIRGLWPVACLSLALAACGSKGTTTGSQETPPVVSLPPAIPLAFQGIVSTLDANAPVTNGQNNARSAPITAFDAMLWDVEASQPTPSDVINYYVARLARVATEMEQPVTAGLRVWAMYNHGFIVKTPTTTFAFDLVEGKASGGSTLWGTQIPEAILNRIDVLMVSHEHTDHWDETTRIPTAIRLRGGAVLYPSAGLQHADVTMPMTDRQVAQIRNLKITAYAGLHNAPVMIFEVVTADGYRVVHTGDNQSSTSLPALQGVDLLLLNGWVNESGATTNIVGMQRSIDKLKPAVMIPGHFEEMAHFRNNRYRYTDGLTLQNDAAERSKTVVLTWGERMDYTLPPCAAGLVRVYESCVVPPAP